MAAFLLDAQMAFSVLCISCITPCVQISSSCNCGVLSHGRVFESPWTVACQARLFMGFPRQEFWSGLPFPSPGDRLHPGVNPCLLCLLRQEDSLSLPPGKPSCKDINQIGLGPTLMASLNYLLSPSTVTFGYTEIELQHKNFFEGIH